MSRTLHHGIQARASEIAINLTTSEFELLILRGLP